MKPVHLLAFAAIVTFGLPSLASADQYRYLGHHPKHRGSGGTFCYIQFPHVHAYAPRRANVLYRKKDGWYHFVGDPAAHGYDGKRHKFYGAHPVQPHQVVLGVEAPESPVVEWCYLKGPHFHAFAPPVDAEFEVKGGVSWYVGTYPPAFYKLKPRYVRINPYYASIKYRRPHVELVAPPAYLDVLVVGATGKRGYAHGHFKAGIWVPVPSIHLRVGGPGHRVKIKHHGHGKFGHHGKIKVRGGAGFKIKARGGAGFKLKAKGGGGVRFRGKVKSRGHKRKHR